MAEHEVSGGRLSRNKSSVDGLKQSGSSRRLMEASSTGIRKERSDRHLHHGSTYDDRGEKSPRGEVEDYDDAIAKVAARFSSNDGRSSGKEQQRRDSRKARADVGEALERRYSRRISKKLDVPENYEDALAKVAARFSAENTRSSGKALVMNRQQTSRDKLPDNYEDALAKVAARFSVENTRASAKALNRQSSRDKLPDNYEDALAKVAARFGGSRSSARSYSSVNHQVVEEKPKRRSSHRSLRDESAMVDDRPKRRTSSKVLLDDAREVADEKPKRRSSHKLFSIGKKETTEEKPKRRTSSRLLDDEREVVEEVQRRLSESSNQSEAEKTSSKENLHRRSEYTRQLSDDSMDFDGAIAEAMNEEELNQGATTSNIDEPKRKVERRGSDSSLDPNKPATIGGPTRGRQRSRGLRRTTSEELHVMELAERAEADVRVRTDPSPKRKPLRKKQSGIKVTFVEDSNEKNGIACTYLENEGPLSPEEKAAAWYGGRNYKLFKSLCYTESVEAKENEDYCTRFEKVWAACATTSVDFAWQEIMKAEHKKSSPNNAVMLAKARCRGFEREIFPDTLLRNRLATVKYVVRSYKQALLSMTVSKEDQETAVREASLRCSQPFRRFARLMAEGDALLVAAWERVTKKDDSLDESRKNTAQMERRASRRDLMAAAGRRSIRNLLGTGESRRDLISSLKSSGSCRKLISSGDRDYNDESRRNLLSGSKGSSSDYDEDSSRDVVSGSSNRPGLMSKVESHRDLLMSLKSSGSSRKLMSEYNRSNISRSESKRNIIGGTSKSDSRPNILDGTRSESRRSMAGSRSESRRHLGSSASVSSQRLQLDHDLDKYCADEPEDTPRPVRRGSRKLQG